MSDMEIQIMCQFRYYRVSIGSMLFFDNTLAKASPQKFYRAVDQMTRDGLLVHERHRGAYSLTSLGFDVACSIN